MKVEQSERGLFEKGFDEDLPRDRMEKILELFPNSETVTDLLLELRELDSFTDMKRGELYPEGSEASPGFAERSQKSTTST